MKLSTKVCALLILLSLVPLGAGADWKIDKQDGVTFAESSDHRPSVVYAMPRVIPGSEVFRAFYKDAVIAEGSLETVYYCGLQGDDALLRSVRYADGKPLALDFRVPKNSRNSFVIGCILSGGSVAVEMRPTGGFGGGMTTEMILTTK